MDVEEVHRLGRHAHVADRAPGAGAADGRGERAGRPDALDDVRGAAAGELADPLDGLVAALLDHVGRAEAARDLQPVGVMAEDDHALGPQPPGGQHGAEPDGAVADHDDGPARPHARGERAVVPGPHDVGEGREGAREAVVGEVGVLGHRDQGPVGERRAHGLALAAVVPAAPVAPGPARGLQPGAAVVAGAVREGEGRDHPLAGAQRAHLGADLLHDAHELVPGAGRPGAVDLELAAVGPQVAAADACVGHPHEGVGGLADRRVGDVLHPDVARPVVHARPHPLLLRSRPASAPAPGD